MRKFELMVNLGCLFFPLAIMILFTAALSLAPVRIPGMIVCLGLYAAGLSLLLAAKIPQFRQGIWTSFGSSQMSRGERHRYKAAYVLLVAGAVLNLMLLFSTGFPG